MMEIGMKGRIEDEEREERGEREEEEEERIDL